MSGAKETTEDTDVSASASKGLLGRYLFLTGHQILELAAMLGGDDEDARETEITLSEYRERFDEETGETMPAGLYASFSDYPEEGCVHLPPNAAHEPTADNEHGDNDDKRS